MAESYKWLRAESGRRGHAWDDVKIETVTVTEIVQHTELTRTEANHLYMLIRRARAAGWRGWEDRRDDSDR